MIHRKYFRGIRAGYVNSIERRVRRVETMRYFRALYVVMVGIKRFLVDLWGCFGGV